MSKYILIILVLIISRNDLLFAQVDQPTEAWLNYPQEIIEFSNRIEMIPISGDDFIRPDYYGGVGAIDAFKSRCKIGCKPVDRSNLLFLELYSGQISNEEYIKSISVLNDREFSYLVDIYSNFDKKEFVNNLCSF